MKNRICIVLLLMILISSLFVGCTLLPMHTHSYSEWTVVKEATCTEAGLQEKVCSCGEKTSAPISATGHLFGDWTVVTESTCTQKGQEERTCATCGEEETRDSELAKHTYGDWTVVKEATCTEDGLELRYCECGATETKVIHAIGHNYESIVTDPTCTEQGYTTHTCHCRDSYVDTYVEALGHTEGSVVVENSVAPNCTTDGSYDNVVYCTVCEAELSRENVTVDALGHEEVPHNAQEPTCTAIGWEAYVTCSRCEYTTYSEIPATGHMDGEWTTDLEPTCTEGGSKHQVCSVCGVTLKTESIGVLGHDEVEHAAQNPKCTEIGWKAYVTCSRCNYSTYEEIPATGHNFTDWTILKDATCTEVGQKERSCVCGEKETREIEIKDHTYENKVCTVCGELKPSVGLVYFLSEDETYYIVYDIGDCADTDIVIPSTYEGKPVKSIGNNAFDYCSNLTSIAIPSSVTSIGGGAFFNCGSLTSITIPDSVIIIDGSAFNGCSSLTSITIPDSVTSIGPFAFYCCSSLESITIPNSVTSIGEQVFGGCTSLTSIIISESITSIPEYAFYGCTSLTSITIPSSVTIIGDSAFGRCTGLTSITIPEGVTSISECAFYNCTNLTSITIPSSITSIGHQAFQNCTGLTSVVFSEDSQLTSLSTVFINCSSLTCVTLPSSLTNMDGTFANCYSLRTVTIPDSVETIGDFAFSNCISLESIIIPSRVKSIGVSAFWFCGNLTSINIPISVTSIDWHAFTDCTSLTSVTFEGDNCWFVTQTEDATNGKFVNLSDAVQNALYLRETYDEYYWYVNPNGHSYQAVITVPTCIEQGLTTHICSNCSDSYVDTYVDALGHDEINHVAQTPTCTEIGWESYVTCSRCNYTTYEEIPSTGHTDGEWIVDVEPDCTTEGSKHQVCATCGDTFKTESIDATGHSYTSVVTSPKCEEQGYTTHTCSICDDSYVDTYIDATGHSYDAVEMPPICTSGGYTVHTCHCGNSYVDAIVDALGHNFQESDTCENCGLNIADVAVATYNMSLTADDNVKGYVVAHLDGNYDAYIKGIGRMMSYNLSPFEVDDYTLVNVYIENGVTSIGELAFYDCDGLTNITIPSSVTFINSSAFNGCSNLANITFEGVPEEISWRAFYQTAYYNNVDNWHDGVLYIGNCLIEAKTTIETCTIKEGTTVIATYAFRNCTKLTNITIPSSVTSIGEYTFCKCTNLTTVTFEQGSQLTSIGMDAFLECKKLTSITIPASVTSIGSSAFYRSGVNSVTFEGTNCWYVTTTYGATTGTFLDVSDSTQNATYLKGSYCGNLWYATPAGHTESESVIENNVDATCTESGSYDTVVYCSNCKTELSRETITVDATGHNYESVVISPTCTTQGYTTHTCHCGDSFADTYVDALGHTEGSIVVENSVAPDCTKDGYYDNVVYCTVCKAELTRNTVVVPALGHTEGSVVVENNVAPKCTIEGFYDNVVYCTVCKAELSRDTVTVDALGHDEVPHDAQVHTCTEIGWSEYVTCSRCDYSTYNEIPPTGHSHNAVVTAPTCTEQGYTTHTCHCGDSYVDTYVDATGHSYEDKACAVCGAKEPSVGLAYTLSDDGNSYIVSGIGDCTDTDVVIPETYNEKPVTNIGERAFMNCSSITSIAIPECVTVIGEYAFYGCSSLTDITIPNNVTSIEQGVFDNCSSLTNITIPSSVTRIEDCAFAGCESLTSVTIPSSVTWIVDGAFAYCTSLASINVDENNPYYKSIDGSLYSKGGTTFIQYALQKADVSFVIPDGVTHISTCAFASSPYLENITIPDSVTSIGMSVFSGCSSLISITIPSSVTSIRYGTFYRCTNLANVYYAGTEKQWQNITVDIANEPLTNATIIYYSSGLEYILSDDGTYYSVSSIGTCTDIDVIIPNTYKAKPVTSIGEYAFEGSVGLTNITIPSSVTSIGKGAFAGCTSLSTITIPNSVTSVGFRAFSGCSSLTSITIPSSVTSVGYGAFEGCTDLTSINVDTNNLNYQSIDGNLYSKDGQTLIQYAVGKSAALFVLPSSLTSIGDRAFSGCSSLTSITIPSSVTSVGYGAFYGCTGLTSITLPTLNTNFGYIFGAINSSYNSSYVPTSLKTVVITGGSSIGSYAFKGCKSLTSITIPNTVTSIGEGAFYGCNSLREITLPFVGATLNGTTNTHFGYIFGASYSSINYVCVPTSLKTVVITGGSSISAKAFEGCSSLTSITIPNTVTSIGESAFYGCNSLREITLPFIGGAENATGYRAVFGYIFGYETSTVSIPYNGTIYQYLSRLYGNTPNDITYKYYFYYIPTSINKVTINGGNIGSNAFYNCNNLTSITIPNTVTRIGESAFYGCSSLTSITIPDSITSIGSEAFYDCSSLTSITIPASVTSIGLYAFYGCSSLASITIPDSVTYIGNYAFYGCSSLKDVYYTGTPTQWNNITIRSFNEYFTSATIHYNYTGK